jgi:phosphotriesterase-related protein
MTNVNTVLGPLDTATLGFTLMHEHIITGAAGLFQDYPELFGPNLMERIVSSLKKAKEGGVDTILDASTFDLGRNINVLVEASRRSGVNIIACTGWWLDIPRDLDGVSANRLAQLFIKDYEQGIAGTSVKAGIIKAGSDKEGVIPAQETVLRAVARAHLKTGAPIMLHSFAPGRVGKQQLAILKEEGVNLRRVKLDHSNDTCDIEYLTWILEQGAYLGMDRYPGPTSISVSTNGRNRVLKALIDAGYADRLLLSHDWILTTIIEETPHLPFRKEILTANPYEFLFIKKVVLPQLRELGIPEAIVNRLCIDGPRQFFEGL